jgi:DNA helicase-2/ATP-dependent DNA helicase PcrA
VERENPAFVEEQTRVQRVIKQIKHRIGTLHRRVAGTQSEIISIRRDFWEDVTVNLEDAVEATETMVSIRQQAEVMSEHERSHRDLTRQIQTLGRLEYAPYFGRIDFLEDHGSETDRIYIGISSFLDDNGEDFLIHDWRAPICSLYYDASPGPAAYEAPAGMIRGELQLKRQYLIRAGKVISIFDTGVTIGDEMLQEILGQVASPQMKSIVATIQREQNRIIRDSRNRLLIVQGVAGSGKTSTALQRVAYLLYHERESLRTENMVMFSPNPLFSSYVANVLPELGEERMQQLTFQTYLRRALGFVDVENLYNQTEFVLTQMEQDGYLTRLRAIEYKSSMAFKDVLDHYVAWLGKDGLVFRGLKFHGQVLISGSDIKAMFYAYGNHISIPNRLQLLKRDLLRALRQHEVAERKKPWVETAIELLDEEAYQATFNQLKRKGGFSEESFDDFSRQQTLLAEQVVHSHFRPLRTLVRQLRFLHVKAVYRKLFHVRGLVNRLGAAESVPANWETICEQTSMQLEAKVLNFEDAVPYMYLKEKLMGQHANTAVRHVFIDEAQDYSAFQLACIKLLFPHARMTLLGDANQAIHLQALADSAFTAAQSLYPTEQTEVLVLNRSYRSTREIVEFTRGIVPGGEKIEAFHRSGPVPVLTRVTDAVQQAEAIVAAIKSVQDRGHRTIAVICKTDAESRLAYDALSPHMHIQRVDQDTEQFKPAPLVIPSYLAKGVEFDAVIVFDASVRAYSRAHEQTLFYTAFSRAMHELQLITMGTPSPFIDQSHCVLA